MLRLRTLLLAAAMCCAVAFGSLHSCALPSDPSAQCIQTHSSHCQVREVTRVNAMQRSNHPHQQHQHQHQHQQQQVASIPATHTIPPLNAAETHRLIELEFLMTRHMLGHYPEELNWTLDQEEHKKLATRIHEFDARTSDNNGECVDHFRKVMAREGDYSWSASKVQEYIREYVNYVAEVDPNAAAVLPPLDSEELCRATLQHALQVRHDRHVSIPATMIQVVRRGIETQAHREFHPIRSGTIAIAKAANPNYVRILSVHEQKIRQLEFHAWQQYLEDMSRMEPRKGWPRDHTSPTRSVLAAGSPRPQHVHRHMHPDHAQGHGQPLERSGSETMYTRAAAAAAAVVARAARGKKHQRHEQEDSPVTSPRARPGHYSDEMEI